MTLNSSEEDILKEIGNIGAGNASKALSDMTGQKIEVGFPTVKLEELDTIPEMIEQESDKMISVWLDVNVEEEEKGGKMGRLILLMNRKSAKELASYLNGREDINNLELDEMDKSALKETGNILSGASLTAITSFLDLTLMEDVPKLDNSSLNQIMNNLVLDISDESSPALIFRTKFSFKEEITSYFLFVFKEGGQELILDRLNK